MTAPNRKNKPNRNDMRYALLELASKDWKLAHLTPRLSTSGTPMAGLIYSTIGVVCPIPLSHFTHHYSS
jgi:hypothetical protein